MENRIEVIKNALYKLGNEVQELGKQHGTKTMCELWGWNCPPLNAKQMGSVAKLLGDKIGKVPEDKLNKKFSADTITGIIDLFKENTLPQLWSGGAAYASPQYFSLIEYIDLVFEPVYETKTDWEKLSSDGMLPKQVNSKLRGYKAQIDRFDIDFGTIEEKIKNINQAHDAANELPTDLEMLRNANEEVANAMTEADKNKILAGAAYEDICQLLQSIKESEAEAKQLVRNTEDAYSAATTRGLGESFQKRADRLANSMWTWVVGLVLALLIGAISGNYRVAELEKLLAEKAGAGSLSLNIFLAIISVAAPVWFAWIATKQIGHRFRLSEDYAFKASVAQAYEGYRREAARVDVSFATRLFGTALDRMEEAPIRFIEQETFGSPWHEFLALRRKPQSKPATGDPSALKRNEQENPAATD